MIYLLDLNKFSDDETDLDICNTNIINIEENEEKDNMTIIIMMKILKFKIMKVMRAKRVMIGAKNKMTMMRVNLEIKRMMNNGI